MGDNLKSDMPSDEEKFGWLTYPPDPPEIFYRVYG
jgi:hypothetical protein